jgi:hypothetical protein
MRIVHLYPFVPAGRHGGTLRLSAALAGTAAAGDPELHYFDPVRGAWRGPCAPEVQGPARAPASGTPSLKRRLFPSTLWESGRHPRRALGAHLDRLALDGRATVFLHTSYLAPLLPELAVEPRRAIVDAYDLVWRAHANDAAAGPAALRGLRAAYAAGVRPRERRALAGAGTLLAAGHEDAGLLRADLGRCEWLPTPTPVDAVAPRPPASGRLRVGMLGNFAHQSTRAGAEVLARSALAGDPRVTIVLAGLASGGAPRPPGTELLGEVERVEDFYAEIDCAVAPVVGGSGMKVKLAEAVLAGRPVVTTPLGAAGYSPAVSRFFTVVEAGALTPPLVERAIRDFAGAAAREALERELGWDRVVAGYAAAVA